MREIAICWETECTSLIGGQSRDPSRTRHAPGRRSSVSAGPADRMRCLCHLLGKQCGWVGLELLGDNFDVRSGIMTKLAWV